MRRIGRAIAIAAALSASPAAAVDCALGGCIDATRLPAASGLNWADLVGRAQRFFGVSANAYIVSSSSMRAYLPYMLPRQATISADQIHIPEIYHAQIEARHAGHQHFVWHYIIGHEMAHGYQYRLRLVEAMKGPFDSVVAAELHADFLAGFFLAREYGLQPVAINQLLSEIQQLPTGRPGDQAYHGEPTQRFYIAMQGALFALKRPSPSREDASVKGLELAFELAQGAKAQ